jgi:hypothetical protein
VTDINETIPRRMAISLADQLEAAMAEIERLTRESVTLRNQIRLQAGWLDGRAYCRTDEEVSQFAEIKRLRAEIDAMRPVVDSMVRVVELDEICDQHPGISYPAGQKAEADLYEAVRDRTRAVDAYRARKS